MERVGDVEWFAHDSSNIFLLINFFYFLVLKETLKSRTRRKNQLQKKDIRVFPPKTVHHKENILFLTFTLFDFIIIISPKLWNNILASAKQFN